MKPISTLAKTRALNIYSFIISLIIILILSMVSIPPDVDGIVYSAIILIYTAGLIIIITDQQRYNHDAIWLILMTLLSSYILTNAILNNVDYRVWPKFVSLILITPFSIRLLSILRSRQSENWWFYLVMAFLLQLIMVCMYKLIFGFFDRSVRFLINGPIVFAWLTGIYAILWVSKVNSTKVSISIVVSCVLIMLWTQSKGPILSLAVAYLYFVGWQRISLILLGLIVLGLIFPPQWLDLGWLGSGRIGMFIEALTGDISLTEFRTFSHRMDLIIESWFIFMDNPFFGTGPSVTNYVIQSENYTYPHNLFLEILSEYGIFGFVLFTLFLLKVFLSANHSGQSVFIFMICCLNFSGDLSYWPLLVAIASVDRKKYEQQNITHGV